MKKWPVCALLALLCMVMLCSIPAYAAEARASDRIDSASVTLGKRSNGDLGGVYSGGLAVWHGYNPFGDYKTQDWREETGAWGINSDKVAYDTYFT